MHSSESYNFDMEKDGTHVSIGIDLGTTNTCVCHVGKNAVGALIDTIIDDFGSLSFPSCVSFSNDEILVGKIAKERRCENSENTLFNSKKLLCQKYCNIPIYLKDLGFTLVEDSESGGIKYEYKYKDEIKYLKPEEVSAYVLRHAKERILETYGRNIIIDAVITVPAFFSEKQRVATKRAAEIAGINCIRICVEPTAAAIAYRKKIKTLKKNGKFLVFDMGGGTLDVSVINVEGNSFNVLSVYGDPHLGGEDIDDLLFEYCIKKYNKKTKKDFDRKNQRYTSQLRMNCEKAKIQLSFTNQTTITIPRREGDDLLEISVEQFKDVISDIIEKIFKPIEKALELANLSVDKIDEIMLIGGSSRIPLIIEEIAEYFGKNPLYLQNPDTAVAIGAAYLAYDISNNETIDESVKIKYQDVNPLPIGVRFSLNKFKEFIPRCAKLPYQNEYIFSTVNKKSKFARIQIYQGESEDCDENILIDEFKLTGLPQNSIIKVRINVTIECIVQVDAYCVNDETIKKSVEISRINEELYNAELHREIEEHKKMMGPTVGKRIVECAKNEADEVIYKARDSASPKIAERIDALAEEINRIMEKKPKKIEDGEKIANEIKSITQKIKEIR